MKQTPKPRKLPVALVTGFDPFDGEAMNPSLVLLVVNVILMAVPVFR